MKIASKTAASSIRNTCHELFGQNLLVPENMLNGVHQELIYFYNLLLNESVFNEFVEYISNQFGTEWFAVATGVEDEPVFICEVSKDRFADFNTWINLKSEFNEVGFSTTNEVFYLIPNNSSEWNLVGHRFYDIFVFNMSPKKADSGIFIETPLKGQIIQGIEASSK